MIFMFDLQLFATQTTLLNTTGNNLSPENKTYYDMRLIDYAEPNLVHNQFGQKRPIPKRGGKTIEFRKFSQLPKATTALTEGVTPSGNILDVKQITATVAQYGDYIEISDILDLTAIDPVLEETVKLLGSQAGRTLDTITRDILAGGTNVLFAGGRASRSELTSSDKVDADLLFQAAAVLKAQNAPTFDGAYIAIMHPYVAYDVMMASKADGSWVDVNKYANPEAIFNGEIGKIGGVRIVESTEAKIVNDNTAGKVFLTLVVGNNAYGVTEVSGGGLETIIKPFGSGQDPLNQRATAGWKATAVAERLVEEYMVRIESSGTFASKAAVN